jgi:hypothetical protein
VPLADVPNRSKEIIHSIEPHHWGALLRQTFEARRTAVEPFPNCLQSKLRGRMRARF